MKGNLFSILLVEDNPADARLARAALNGGQIQHSLSIVKDGVEAMDFLARIGPYKDAERPDMIFLDLNLPRKDGREVLSEIKNDENLKRIPVIVLTTSRAETDIVASYDLNANCYIIKPSDVDQYFNAIRGAETFWLTVATRSPR